MSLPRRLLIGALAATCLPACAADVGRTVPPTHHCLDAWDSPRQHPCTPGEAAAQRHHFALIEEAQRNHRRFLHARDELSAAGGAVAASQAMRDVASAPLLGDYVSFLQAQLQAGRRVDGVSVVRFLRPRAEAEGADLALEVCHDGRRLAVWDKGATASYPGRLIEGVVFYRRIDGVLKLWRGRQQPIVGCEAP